MSPTYLLQLIFFAALQFSTVFGSATTITVNGQDGGSPSVVMGNAVTIYSTEVVTDSRGVALSTITGAVSTYTSVGYSQSVITLTTSVPVTSTWTSQGDNTVIVVTTYTVQTTSCVTEVLTSMIVSTVSTELMTIVSCQDKICKTIYSSTVGNNAINGVVTLQTVDAVATTILGSSSPSDTVVTSTVTQGLSTVSSSSSSSSTSSNSGSVTTITYLLGNSVATTTAVANTGLTVTLTNGQTTTMKSTNPSTSSRSATFTFKDIAISNKGKLSASTFLLLLGLLFA